MFNGFVHFPLEITCRNIFIKFLQKEKKQEYLRLKVRGWEEREITQKTIISLTTYNEKFSYTKNVRRKGVENTSYNRLLFVTKAYTGNKNSYLQSLKNIGMNKEKHKSIS